MHACMHACIHFYSCVVVVVCCYYEMMIRCKINWNISLIPVWKGFDSISTYILLISLIHIRIHSQGQKSERNWWKIVAWSAHAHPGKHEKKTQTHITNDVAQSHFLRVRVWMRLNCSHPSLGVPPFLFLSLFFIRVCFRMISIHVI